MISNSTFFPPSQSRHGRNIMSEDLGKKKKTFLGGLGPHQRITCGPHLWASDVARLNCVPCRMSHGVGSEDHGGDVCKCRHLDWPPSEPRGTWWLIPRVKTLNMSKTAINLTLTINTTAERQTNNGHNRIEGYDPVVSVIGEK